MDDDRKTVKDMRIVEKKEMNEQIQEFKSENQTETAMPQQVSPKSAKKVRRVGTFTMGCVMIVVGVAILCSSILGWDNLMLLAKLAPIVLILLGVEVLVASFVQKAKLKYDVFGVILSSLVVCVLVTAAVGYQWVFVQLPKVEKIERMAQDYISDKLYESVNREGISDVRVHFSRQMNQWAEENIQETMKNSDIFLDITLQPEYAQPDRLAEKAVEINGVIKQQFSEIGLNFIHISYRAQNQETKNSSNLYLQGRYAFDQNAAQLEQNVQNEENRYDIHDLVEEYELQLKDYRTQIDELTHQLETEKIEHEIQLQELQNQNNAA